MPLYFCWLGIEALQCPKTASRCVSGGLAGSGNVIALESIARHCLSIAWRCRALRGAEAMIEHLSLAQNGRIGTS